MCKKNSIKFGYNSTGTNLRHDPPEIGTKLLYDFGANFGNLL